MLDRICATLEVAAPKNPRQLNPLVLAYIGDAVFDLVVRSMLVCSYDVKAHTLHRMSSRRVCAAAQARALLSVLPELTEEEGDIVRRARNAKPGTIPKNASPEDYAMATALEALLGWLYLDKQEDRLWHIVERCIASQEPDKLDRAVPFHP